MSAHETFDDLKKNLRGRETSKSVDFVGLLYQRCQNGRENERLWVI